MHRMTLVAVALVAAALSSCRHAEESARFDRNRLNIGVYGFDPSVWDERHVDDLKACGVDFVVELPYTNKTESCAKVLDLLQVRDMGAFVSRVVKGWSGAYAHATGKMRDYRPVGEYERAAAKFVDHPAVWGICFCDEPSALDMKTCGEDYAALGRLFPDKVIMFNLYPNYANAAKPDGDQVKSELGVPSYREYLDSFCANVRSDYLCYDFYPYRAESHIGKFWANFELAAAACERTSRDLWIVLQVNSRFKDKWISENQLRYQAYAAMAYGVRTVMWACYTQWWWCNAVVVDGEKTRQYDRLRKVNHEIKSIAPHYMGYRRKSTSFVGFDGTPWLEGAAVESAGEFIGAGVEGLKADDDGPLVIGNLISRHGDGARALFILAADDPYDIGNKARKVSFRVGERRLRITGREGEIPFETDGGVVSFVFHSNDFAFVELLSDAG